MWIEWENHSGSSLFRNQTDILNFQQVSHFIHWWVHYIFNMIDINFIEKWLEQFPHRITARRIRFQNLHLDYLSLIPFSFWSPSTFFLWNNEYRHSIGLQRQFRLPSDDMFWWKINWPIPYKIISVRSIFITIPYLVSGWLTWILLLHWNIWFRIYHLR